MSVSTPTQYPKSGKRSPKARTDNQSAANWDREAGGNTPTDTSYPNPGIRDYGSDYKVKSGGCSGNGASVEPDTYPQKRRPFGTEVTP